MRALLGRVLLVVGFYLSSLHIYCATPFWPAEFLLKNQLTTLWGFPCMLFVNFSLVAFNIFSVSLVFVSLICVWVCSSLGLSCTVLSALPGLECFLSHVREVFGYNLFKYFLRPFSLSSPSGPL